MSPSAAYDGAASASPSLGASLDPASARGRVGAASTPPPSPLLVAMLAWLERDGLGDLSRWRYLDARRRRDRRPPPRRRDLALGPRAARPRAVAEAALVGAIGRGAPRHPGRGSDCRCPAASTALTAHLQIASPTPTARARRRPPRRRGIEDVAATSWPANAAAPRAGDSVPPIPRSRHCSSLVDALARSRRTTVRIHRASRYFPATDASSSSQSAAAALPGSRGRGARAARAS